MGLFNKISDVVSGAVSKTETIRVSIEELADIVAKEFIYGSDKSFLIKVKKTAKGGVVVTKQLKSKDERFEFHVGARPHGLIWLASKPVWVYDKAERKFYQLDKNINWKKFYKVIEARIEEEGHSN